MKATATAPTTTAPAATGIQMLDILGDLAKPAATKSSAKNYPAIPDADGSVGQLADQLASDLDEWKALDASVTTGKAELTALGRGWLNYYKLSSTYTEVLDLSQWVRRRVAEFAIPHAEMADNDGEAALTNDIGDVGVAGGPFVSAVVTEPAAIC